MPKPHRGWSRLASIVYVLMLAAGFGYTLVWLLISVKSGGDPWQQGDWLINSWNQSIRRGPLGSAILMMSDLSGLGPLWVTGALQAGLLCALYALFAMATLRGRIPALHGLLLISTPVMFEIFWVTARDGALRKELIAFVALMALIVGHQRGNRTLKAASVILMAVAMAAHELNVLLLPLYLILNLMVARNAAEYRFFWFSSLFLGVAAGLAMAYAIRFAAIGDLARCVDR